MRILPLTAATLALAVAACADGTPTAAPPEGLSAPTSASPAAALVAGTAGSFAPQSGDRILFDARASMQQATGVWDAVNRIASGASYNGTWTFTSNVDGSGTNALRLDVQPGSSTCQRVTNTVNVPLPTPYPRRLVFQWKQHLGRTTTGGGEASVGAFALDDACGGVDRTQVRAFRDTSAANAGRLEYQWASNGLASQVQRFNPNVTLATLDRATYDLRQMVGRTVTSTLYLQAESAPGAGDGVLRLWVDGKLVKEVTRAALGTQAFKRLNFPGTMALPRAPQSEYWWDLVAWVPADSATGGTTPPPATGDTTGTAGGDTTSAGGTPTADTTIARLVLDNANPSLVVGKTLQLKATALNAAGDTLAKTIAWKSSAAAVATVTSAGLVTGVAAGSATIVASAENDTARAIVTVTTVPVATVAVSPATASVQAGTTQQFTATLKDANGSVLTGRSVAWTTSNTAVATISASGLLNAVATGSVTVTAASEGKGGTASVTITAPPPPPTAGAGVVDPTLLPKATGQRPIANAYGRSIAAGQTYVDPNTGVTVLKVTDPRTPVSNSGMYHGYSEGGPYVSLPWTGTDGATYYTLWLAWGQGWFVDVKYPAMTMSNWRAAPVSNEGEGAWSLNPSTPRIFYYSGSNTLNRYDTQGMRIASTAGFPFNIPSTTGSNYSWLQTQVNDTWIVGMTTSNNTVVAYRPADGTVRTISRASSGLDIDEPHIDREQPVVYISAASSDPQNVIYNLATNTRVNPRDTQGIINDDHNAPLRGKIVGVSWQANATVAVDWQGNVTRLPGGSPTDWSGDFHTAGQWIFNNPSEYWAVDQWQRAGSYPVYLGMIGLMSTGGDIRLLAAHDGTGGGYQSGGQPHPTLAPDGKLIMWTSNMNGSGRFDVFLARVPTR